ncbi:protein of unknown function DUF45 [Methanolacinia petrolearia DSM 11571]|uniref:YgjP-like metallopeptidase domain-containing protein n=1 Tax=Methanolacinia petrolearia (strain DSM 11571 / OCM 486 / SEBR 4847) TaxID=679926 RepID=E1RHM2_METP4|nr:SprT family zinc-dependent metalloprotease [Methanolacinia petrolearia]ADN35331.1 protein of unknown function DUF45 [Methanolacinia petrolearia DSM 11571]
MKQYPFEIIINHREVSSSRIRISPDCRVYVTAPRGADIEALIDSKIEWIMKKIGELDRLASEYQTGDGSFIYNGRMWHPVFSESRPVTFSWPDIHYPSVEKLRKAVSQELKEDIIHRLDHYSKKMDVEYSRVSIRNQRTRWGSCSGKGNLNFNIRSMALPENIRDYLVVHELSHRIEMNHSPAFWKKVSEYYPGFRQAEKELKAYWIIIARSRIWGSLLGSKDI